MIAKRDVADIEAIADAREAERKAEAEWIAEVERKAAEAEAAEKKRKAEAKKSAARERALNEAKKPEAEKAATAAAAPKPVVARAINFANVGCNEAHHDSIRQFEGPVVFAQPYRANGPLANASAAQGRIVIVARDPMDIPENERCSFDEKAQRCMAAGAIGMLIANTTYSLVHFNVFQRLPCAMITVSYAAGLKDGDYVMVDGGQICQRTLRRCAAHTNPLSRAHPVIPFFWFTAQEHRIRSGQPS